MQIWPCLHLQCQSLHPVERKFDLWLWPIFGSFKVNTLVTEICLHFQCHPFHSVERKFDLWPWPIFGSFKANTLVTVYPKYLRMWYSSDRLWDVKHQFWPPFAPLPGPNIKILKLFYVCTGHCFSGPRILFDNSKNSQQSCSDKLYNRTHNILPPGANMKIPKPYCISTGCHLSYFKRLIYSVLKRRRSSRTTKRKA